MRPPISIGDRGIGDKGLEPLLTESESVVLPLHQSPGTEQADCTPGGGVGKKRQSRASHVPFGSASLRVWTGLARPYWARRAAYPLGGWTAGEGIFGADAAIGGTSGTADGGASGFSTGSPRRRLRASVIDRSNLPRMAFTWLKASFGCVIVMDPSVVHSSYRPPRRATWVRDQ